MIMEREYISPIPKVWHEIHLNLVSYWEHELKKESPKPPIPLILAGWNFSEDWEKKLRWSDTIAWAKKNNCEFLIPVLSNEDVYFG
jgi:hypothetical protein